MQINKGYKIGLLALSSLAILYYGVLFLKSRSIFSKYNDYYISYAENKDLSIAAPVKFKGHVVGRVTKIEIIPKQNYSTLVTIEVDKRFPLTDKSKVLLTNTNMFGGNALELDLHQGGTPITKHDIIPGQLHPDFTTADIKTMAAQASTITAQVSTITTNLIKNTQAVNIILDNLEKTSHTLNAVIDTVQLNVTAITKNIVAISTPLADPTEGLPAIISSINKTLIAIESLPLKDTALRVTCILKNIETLLQNISNNRGTLGLLINDTTLYNNLNHSVENLNALFFSIKNQPARYVHFSLFGSKKK